MTTTTLPSLITIECSRPKDSYTLLKAGPSLIVHLAGPGQRGGTGPCICGFDRHGSGVGFSVGGGVTGPTFHHEVCQDCARLAGDTPIRGLHAALFTTAPQSCPDCDGQGEISTGRDYYGVHQTTTCAACHGTGDTPPPPARGDNQ